MARIESKRGIDEQPMLAGFHHASRTVADLETSLVFYRDHLGLDVVLDEVISGEGLDRTTGLVSTEARVVELGVVGKPPYLELLEYRSPTDMAISPRPCAPGAHHVCFQVDDITWVHERLTDLGVEFTYPPQEVAGGGFRGDWAAYCFDPEGMIVELWEVSGPVGADGTEG